MWTLRQSESQGFAGCLSPQTLEAPSDVATVVLASLGHGMPLQSLYQAFATDQRAIDLLQRGKAGWIRIMTLENQKGNCNSNTIVYTCIYCI